MTNPAGARPAPPPTGIDRAAGRTGGQGTATAGATGDAPAAPVSAGVSATAGSRRPAWTLRSRLLLVVAVLLVAVSAVVGVVSVSVFHSSSITRLDEDLRSAITRADVAITSRPGAPGAEQDVNVVFQVPGQQVGTLAAIASSSGPGSVSAGYVSETGQITPVGRTATEALAAVPIDGRAHSIDAGVFGHYRALGARASDDVSVVLALPLAEVEAETTQLTVTIAVVALAGLVLALAVGSIIVGRALAPLSRVTSTAQRVSELPLDRGDVALAERVPVEADDRTEVGRLGAAFNRMLGHVAAALGARERSEQQVRRFVADASHELRTPLASIRGYAELIRLHGGSLPPDVVHSLGRIESESVRMTELVEDLLLLARLDEGRELRRDRVDLSRIVAEALGDARAAGPDHHWSLALPDAAVEVTGDEGRLRQLVVNLLANARVHTPEGTRVTASIAIEPRPPDASSAGRPVAGDIVEPGAGTAALTIADDGPGVPPELAGSLFERFARGDSSRSRRAGSTGLGLAIVRAVAIAHGGGVVVASEPGDTRFTVRLPLAPPEASDALASSGAPETSLAASSGRAPAGPEAGAGSAGQAQPRA